MEIVILPEYRTFTVLLPRWDVEVAFVKTADDVFYLPFRQLCAAMGVNYTSQLEVIKDPEDEHYASPGALGWAKVRTRGGEQEVVCLRKREAAWWIGHINPKKCKITVRGPLAAFQTDLMAAADRLLFGDLSGVLGASQALMEYRPPKGTLTFHCVRCGAPHVLEIGNGHVAINIDSEEEK